MRLGADRSHDVSLYDGICLLLILRRSRLSTMFITSSESTGSSTPLFPVSVCCLYLPHLSLSPPSLSSPSLSLSTPSLSSVSLYPISLSLTPLTFPHLYLSQPHLTLISPSTPSIPLNPQSLINIYAPTKKTQIAYTVYFLQKHTRSMTHSSLIKTFHTL